MVIVLFLGWFGYSCWRILTSLSEIDFAIFLVSGLSLAIDHGILQIASASQTPAVYV